MEQIYQLNTVRKMCSYAEYNKLNNNMDDIQALKCFSIIKRELFTDETVFFTFCGIHKYESLTKHEGIYAYAITNKRIIYAKKKMFSEHFSSIPLEKVVDVTFDFSSNVNILSIHTISKDILIGINKISADYLCDFLPDAILKLRNSDSSITASDIVPESDISSFLDGNFDHIPNSMLKQKKIQKIGLIVLSILCVSLVILAIYYFSTKPKPNYVGLDNGLRYYLSNNDAITGYKIGNNGRIDVYVNDIIWLNSSQLEKASFCRSINDIATLLCYQYNITDTYALVYYYSQKGIKVAEPKVLSLESEILY